ncbi:MAG: ABC transporter permease [Syntrophales bacterium]|nr:ABC transporter permease [Syntrophales bacterium]
MSFRMATIVCSLVIFLLYGGLIASLLYFFHGPSFFEVLRSERTAYALLLSVVTATVVTICSVAVAVPAAYALSRYRFPGREIIDAVLELPMVVSPIALGAMILIFFSTPTGAFLQERGLYVIFTVGGIIIAQFVTTAGVATRLIKTVFDDIPRRYEELAWTLGASEAKAFFTVLVPMGRRGILTAALLTWAKALGEFGATITVAGSMAFRTETLPIAVFMNLAHGDIEGAAILVLILIALGLAVLGGGRFLAGRGGFGEVTRHEAI